MNALNFSFNDLVFDEALIGRFDINGPRYTSYPTADRFSDAFTLNDAKDFLTKRAQNPKRALSLYFHIPFCSTICFYCACNKIATKDHSTSSVYLDYVAKELALHEPFLTTDAARAVEQLHWGGGTPTFLSHNEIRQLMALTQKHFRLQKNGEYSIEVDPRKVSVETVALLGELGFNRMSVGVQDFDEKVQKAINRIQSEEETATVINAARANGFQSVSIDLIYGLPHQNATRFENTLDRVLTFKPNRLSIYNYAHLPQLFMPQRRINSEDLPTPEMKLAILSMTIQKLINAGYLFIGMDHFALPNDELAIAQKAGRLHRNFQGYSTHKDCDMLAFGTSSISKVGDSYYQNQKTQDSYYAALDAGNLPVLRGIALDNDDILRRDLIQQLMCHFALDFKAVESRYSIDFKTYFSEELVQLKDMQSAGLLELSDSKIQILPAGRMLVRVVAMVFDKYLRQSRARYSKVI